MKSKKGNSNQLFGVFILVLVTLIIIIGVIKIIPNITINANLANIQERKYNKVLNNLYYTDELIENKGKENKEEILSYYETIANYLEETYPSITFYIGNFNYDTLNNNMIFMVYQMLDMAIVNKTNFSICIENGSIKEEASSVPVNLLDNGLEASKRIDINDIKKTALDLAKQNVKKIFTNGSSKTIKGEYYLEYDNNKFYYKVLLNNGSYVKVDVNTGKVIDSYFSNGIET